MKPSRWALVAMTTLAVIVGLGPAKAATPASGKVSAAAPKVTWTGQTTNSAVAYNAMTRAPEDTPCEAPTCDTFALSVVDGGGDLELSNELTAAASGGIRVTAPDGTVTFASGPSNAGAPFKLKLKAAKAGAYTVDMTNSFVQAPTGASSYTGSAELLGLAAPAPEGGATPAPTPAPSATPTPTPSPAPGESAPAPQPQPPAAAAPRPAVVAFDLNVEVNRLSARKLRRARRFSALVRVSRAVTNVELTLRRGKRVIASSSAGEFAGRTRIGLRAGRLMPGRYTVVAAAVDDQGVQVVRSIAVTVGR